MLQTAWATRAVNLHHLRGGSDTGIQLTACVFFTWLLGSLGCAGVLLFFLAGARRGQKKRAPHTSARTTHVRWPRALRNANVPRLGCPALPAAIFAMCFQPPSLLIPSSPFSPPHSLASCPSFMVSIVFEQGEEVKETTSPWKFILGLGCLTAPLISGRNAS